MSDKVPFKSLYYYKTNDSYYVKCAQLRDYYKVNKLFSKYEINVLACKDKSYTQVKTTDSAKLALILSDFYGTKISPEQIEESTNDVPNPSQTPASKTASLPVSLPKSSSPAPESKPAAISAPQPNSVQNSPNNSISAAKTVSTPVTKPNSDLQPAQEKTGFTFDSLYYYKKEGVYYVKSKEFKDVHRKKNLICKYGELRLKSVKNEDNLFEVTTGDPVEFSKLLTEIFETRITPEQVESHAKKPPDTYPPTIPVEKTSSTPTNASVYTPPLNSKLVPPASKIPSTPIPKAKPATNMIPASTEQTSSAEILSDFGPDTIQVNLEQYKKLLKILGAPPNMKPSKFAKLVFQPND